MKFGRRPPRRQDAGREIDLTSASNGIPSWRLGVLAVSSVVLLHFLAAFGHATEPAPVGWRGDGSGRYPSATPPLEWSETKNVRWKTAIGPNRYSSPIVVGDRVFVTADPARLVCVNADDGRILWVKSNDFADLP